MNCTTLRFSVTLLPALLCIGSIALGQHSDINFEYVSGAIVLSTTSGMPVGTGTMPTDGIFQQFETNPGFASEADVGLGIDPDNQIVFNTLGPLELWTSGDFADILDDTSLRIENNGIAPDTVIESDSAAQPGSFSPAANLIGEANANGDFHSHVKFFLEPNNGTAPPPPAFGAYGVRMTLSTDATGIADSDPFYLVFNFGLDGQEFDTAVSAFAALLDEPLLSGDFNGDGFVGLADYTVWRDNLGADESSMVLSGNGNGGTVDVTDYQLWKSHFGSSLPGGLAGVHSTVPEPGSAALLLLLGGALWTVSKRNRFSAGDLLVEESPM